MRTALILLALVCFSPVYARPQANLLQNPDGDAQELIWKAFGDAKVEDCGTGKCFVIRNRGSFTQNVSIVPALIGKYALLIGDGSSERVNADGSITGLPNIYGYMMDGPSPEGGRIHAYLQGQYMLARPSEPGAWTEMRGTFKIVPGTVVISFMLQQAERRGDPQNGSAARFDNLGLYIFDTEKAANDFLASRHH